VPLAFFVFLADSGLSGGFYL